MQTNRLLKIFLFVFLFFCLSLSISTRADVLWDQQPYSSYWLLGTILDQEFSDAVNSTNYIVTDVVFGSDVTVDTVTTYFSYSGMSTSLWPTGAVSARLNIFTDNPGDPANGTEVNANLSLISDHSMFELTAFSLGIDLSAGTYWFGLTPMLDSITYSQEWHLPTATPIGQLDKAINPSGAYGYDTEWFDAWPTFHPAVSPNTWDAAITITGSAGTPVPEPSTIILLGTGLAGLAGFIRKKFLQK